MSAFPEHTPFVASPDPITRFARAAWHLLLSAILLYGVGVSAYVLVFAFGGDRWAWVAFANNFLPWWALGGLVAACAGLLSRWRWLLVPVQLPVLIAFALLYGTLLLPQTPHTAAATPTGPHFSAATYNIRGAESDPAAVTRAIVALDAAVVGLQEVAPAQSEHIQTTLADVYPYQVHYPLLPVHGVALLSRYPVRSEEMFQPQPGAMLHLRAVIDVDGVPVTVYVVHPTIPTNLALPWRYDTQDRDAQIAALQRDHLARETGPVIVLGDFNMSDLSAPYDAMDETFDDAFRTAGRGLGFTFPAGRPVRLMPHLLRLDYVWYNHHIAALDARTGGDSGTSDHLPVIADLALKESYAAE